MDNLSVPGRRAEAADVETRFQALVQSPLRAALLRFLCARPEEAFDVEALMQTFGRMRLDVENCIRELVAFGVAHRIAGGGTPRYALVQPGRATRSAICSISSSSGARRSATKIARRRSSASAR